MLASLPAMAQTRTITGSVSDTKGEPLEQVLVYVEGTNRTVYTGLEGMFSVEASTGQVLQFSMVGFETRKITVGDKDVINIRMKERDDMKLNDLVVVGYSKVERRDLTGSVSSVKPLENQGFQTIDQMLQGAAPGVYMSNSSGAIGGANVLNIRGISSIIGDNNPLYVIDGVPVYSTDRGSNSLSTHGGSVPAASMGGGVGGGSMKYNYDLKYSFEKNPLAALNPDDIESIEILKDAFSTAIYGSRGAAGVVLITTKKGSKGRTRINVGYTMSLDNPIGKLKLLDGNDYAGVYNQYYNTTAYPANHNTDWIDAVTRTAVSNGVQASVSSGHGNTSVFASLSYDNNQSYIINQDMKRYAARLNVDTKLNTKWGFGANVSLSYMDNDAVNAGDIYSAALRKAPNLPIYNERGDYAYGYQPNPLGDNEAYNPVAMARNNTNNVKDTRVVGNLYLEFNPFRWLSFRTELGTDIYNSFSNVYKPKLPDYVTSVISNTATENSNNNRKLVSNNYININYLFGEHFIQGVLGQSYEYTYQQMMGVAGNNFLSPALSGVGAAQTKRVLSAYTQKTALFSAFARIYYRWKDKYMLGFTYRLDGSSRYNRNHRYLSTPSVSAGWRMSDETFFKEALPFVNEAKIRGSFGVSSKDGNNSYYGAQPVFVLNTLTQYGGNSYLQMSQPGNENLNWERTYTWDAGLDLGMFNDRVKVTLDYYYKKTTNMLFPSDLPYYTGYSKENQNIADMSNQGIDLQIVSTNISTPDFNWMTTLNLSRSTNKILKLNFTGNQLDQLNYSYKYYEVGKPAAQWYLHRWVGVDPMTGDPQWQYKDGSISTYPPAANSQTSQENKFVEGTALPTFYGSLTNNLTYRDFELDFMFNFAVGSHMMNSTRATLLTYTQNEAYNLSQDILKMWQTPGQHTEIPKLHNASIIGNYDYTASITTTRFLENNSYLRLKYLTLAYNLPHRLLRRTHFLERCRIFITVTNLFTITKYSGLDPEVSAYGSSAVSAGYDNMTMPQSRSYQFGVKLAF